MTGDTTVITFRRLIDHPIDEVWRALTDADELIKWWGQATVDLVQLIFFVRLLNVDPDEESAEMHAMITELFVPNVLQLDGDLHGRVRFDLESQDDKTLLAFSSTLGIPSEQQSMEMTGWHVHLDALERSLAGQANDLVDLLPVWQPVHNRYLQQSRRA